MAKVVICDDDATMRAVMAGIAADVGLDVVAETDRGSDVLELVRRFDIDIVVLDLSMGSVSGNTVIRALREQALDPTVVVFSAYVGDAVDLRRDGVELVVEKPDFEGFRQALLAALAIERDDPDVDAGVAERRAPSRPVDEAAPQWRSPSGLEPERAIRDRLEGCQAGDSVLAVAVIVDAAHLASTHGDLLAADHLLEPARALRHACRVQDHVLVEPACGGYLVLLRGGSEQAPESVWRRACGRLERLANPPDLAGAWTMVIDGVEPAEARARAVGAAASAHGPGLVRA